MSYNTVLAAIHNALLGRTAGTKVQVSAHEAAEVAILDYVEATRPRRAHGSAVANVNCVLTWDVPFADLNYGFTVNGFDADGNLCVISLTGKTTANITVQTYIASTLFAIANSY